MHLLLARMSTMIFLVRSASLCYSGFSQPFRSTISWNRFRVKDAEARQCCTMKIITDTKFRLLDFREICIDIQVQRFFILSLQVSRSLTCRLIVRTRRMQNEKSVCEPNKVNYCSVQLTPKPPDFSAIRQAAEMRSLQNAKTKNPCIVWTRSIGFVVFNCRHCYLQYYGRR